MTSPLEINMGLMEYVQFIADCDFILLEYGAPQQMDKLVEECGEYIAARTKFNKEPTPKNKAHMLEEFADVCVLVTQVLMGAMEKDSKFVAAMAAFKAKRQVDRIKERRENA